MAGTKGQRVILVTAEQGGSLAKLTELVFGFFIRLRDGPAPRKGLYYRGGVG
jgi:hypothetical protein